MNIHRTMKLACFLGLTSPFYLINCATTQMAGQQSDDARLSGRVGRALTADPEVKRYKIDVDTIDGVVTLRGTVDDQNAKSSAEQVAKNTNGVREVVNKLQVGEPEKGEVSDLALKTKIGAKLSADPEIHRLDIDVDVENGVVYLSGVVHDEVAKQEAEKLASNVEGVQRVENELTVNHEDQPLVNDKEAEKPKG